jgi:hypothetical protein
MRDRLNLNFNLIQHNFNYANILSFLEIILEKVEKEYMLCADDVAEENGYSRSLHEEIYNLTLVKGRKDLLDNLIEEIKKII